MFFKRKQRNPLFGDFRIQEKYNAGTRTTAYIIQRYDVGTLYGDLYWKTLRVYPSMSEALEVIPHLRAEYNVKHHYV
jgi:hypothetical protein